MKILTVSDHVDSILYENEKCDEYRGVDLILSCGDLPPEYLSFLTSSFDAPLYYVCGNHDLRYQSKTPDGCLNLHSNIIQKQGINFIGFEGSRWYNGGPYQYTDRNMNRIIRKMRFKIWRRNRIDVVVTHAPPRHIHDAEDRCHRGFNGFQKIIKKYQPDYFIHGHIHKIFEDPGQRITTIKNTKVINSYGHFILEIDQKKNIR